MISVIVLALDGQSDDDVEYVHELVVRSLVWLVSAVVAGVVRDVTLAVPSGLGLSEVADHSGCGLVQAEDEGDRLRAAIAACREPRVLVLREGFHPEAGLAVEIDSFVRREPGEAMALLLSTPETATQRLFPDRAPIVGVLAPRQACLDRAPKSFAGLARMARRGARLRARAGRIV